MVFERSENEPDEYDPEAEFEDPESDSITIPDVAPEEPSTPEVSIPTISTDETDVPKEVSQQFWGLVVVVNVAILAMALGVMILVLQGMETIGTVLIGGGLVLATLAVRRLRNFETDTVDPPLDDSEETDDTDTPS